MFARHPVADRPAAGAARAGMTGAEVRYDDGTMGEVRLHAGKAPRFSAWVPPTADFDRLLLAPGGDFPLPTPVGNAILVRRPRVSGECRIIRLRQVDPNEFSVIRWNTIVSRGGVMPAWRGANVAKALAALAAGLWCSAAVSASATTFAFDQTGTTVAGFVVDASISIDGTLADLPTISNSFNPGSVRLISAVGI